MYVMFCLRIQRDSWNTSKITREVFFHAASVHCVYYTYTCRDQTSQNLLIIAVNNEYAT